MSDRHEAHDFVRLGRQHHPEPRPRRRDLGLEVARAQRRDDGGTVLAEPPRARQVREIVAPRHPAHSYTPDVAAGLVQLGLHDDVRGVWMLPVQPAEPTREVIARFARAMSREIGVMSVPKASSAR